jgi:hypothetical protein
MLKETVTEIEDVRVVLMDSISYIAEADRDAVVVSASHGGTSSGEYATRHPALLVFFNDAGVGKDNAGTTALVMLDDLQVPAAAVRHTSARIGDADDHWRNGQVSYVNSAAAAAGVRAGMSVQEAAVARIRSSPHD